MNRITIQDLKRIGIDGYNSDLLALSNRINFLLEQEQFLMIIDEVHEYVKQGGELAQYKYETLKNDYDILNDDYDSLETDYNVLQTKYDLLKAKYENLKEEK